jgi:hypothetical protein
MIALEQITVIGFSGDQLPHKPASVNRRTHVKQRIDP